MHWSTWREHFERNADRPLPEVTPPALAPAQHRQLLWSLQRFQLGEAGEGRIAQQIDQVRFGGIDADYRAALKRFIAEEGRHARILKAMVEALGGTILTRQWAERMFVHVRRLFGVRFKLLVLQVAEVIGIGFYGVLAAALPASALTQALKQICGDEEAHLRFHRDFFRSQRGTVVGALLRAAWWPLGACAIAAMLLDHRATLRALGVPLRTAAARLWAQVARATSQEPGAVPVWREHLRQKSDW
jgi:hypothetical protein